MESIAATSSLAAADVGGRASSDPVLLLQSMCDGGGDGGGDICSVWCSMNGMKGLAAC